MFDEAPVFFFWCTARRGTNANGKLHLNVYFIPNASICNGKVGYSMNIFSKNPEMLPRLCFAVDDYE